MITILVWIRESKGGIVGRGKGTVFRKEVGGWGSVPAGGVSFVGKGGAI